eukprot:14447-Pleurochrysis_carterae.AAC.1
MERERGGRRRWRRRRRCVARRGEALSHVELRRAQLKQIRGDGDGSVGCIRSNVNDACEDGVIAAKSDHRGIVGGARQRRAEQPEEEGGDSGRRRRRVQQCCADGEDGAE